MRRRILATIVLVTTSAASAQMGTEEAAAMGRRLGLEQNAKTAVVGGALNGAASMIGNAIGGVFGGSRAFSGSVEDAASAIMALNSAKPPASPPGGSTEEIDARCAATSRDAFERSADQAVALFPEDKRARLKATMLADYDARVTRHKQRTGIDALPLALESLRAALKMQ